MRVFSKVWAAACAAGWTATCVVGVALAQQAGTVSPDAAFVKAGAWAFPRAHSPDQSVLKHSPAPRPDMSKPLRVAGSTRTYTLAQMSSGFNAPDWFPREHPPMPHIVAYGRKPTWACGYCHQPDGEGDPGSASLEGLSKGYIVEQVKAFRRGQRSAPDPVMLEEARHVTDADLERAAAYFSKLKFRPMERVVETAIVPKTHWEYFVRVPDSDGTHEPLGERIIETSADFALYQLGDYRPGFVAYVPPGSIEAGAKIATHGVGAAAACGSCHGTDLQGVGNIPRLAGRSPTYIARELILFHEGKRMNPGAAPMRAEVSKLTLKDMIDVAAYASSRK